VKHKAAGKKGSIFFNNCLLIFGAQAVWVLNIQPKGFEHVSV